MSSPSSESAPATRSTPPARCMYPTRSTAVASTVETTTVPRGLLTLSTGTAARFRRATNTTPDGAADDRRPVLLHHHLKFLRAMMGRTVILRSREEADVVASAPVLHQQRYELIRRQAAEPSVFGRHDDVEPPRGACDLSFGREAAQRLASGCLGDPEGRAKFGRSKVMLAAGGQIGDDVARSGCGRCKHSSGKVALFVTLQKQKRNLRGPTVDRGSRMAAQEIGRQSSAPVLSPLPLPLPCTPADPPKGCSSLTRLACAAYRERAVREVRAFAVATKQSPRFGVSRRLPCRRRTSRARRLVSARSRVRAFPAVGFRYQS